MTDNNSTHSTNDPEPKKSIWSILGPRMVTGASDNDPSGIATYSQARAKFGFGLITVAAMALAALIVFGRLRSAFY